jgi:O-antigen/teichoic acid export membrane protein
MVKKIKNRISALLPKGYFARNAAILAGGTVAGQLIVTLASPILTRLYVPDDFGTLATYSSILTVFLAVAMLRYEYAILLPEEDGPAANLLIVAELVLLCISVSVGLLLPWLLKIGVLGGSMLLLAPYFWLMPIGLFGAGSYVCVSFWALRMRAYKPVARTKVTQLVSQAGAQLVLGAWISGPFGLLIGDTLGRVAGTGALIHYSLRRSGDVFRRVQPAAIWRVACRYKRFPLFSSGAALINAVSNQLPVLLLAAWYGPRVLGWYALVNRALSMPMLMIGQGIQQVFSSEGARLAVQDPPAFQRLFYRCARGLFLMGLIPIGIVFLFGPWLFALVFGEAWREAGVYARLICPMQLVTFMSWPLSLTLSILERQDMQLLTDIVRLAAIGGGMWACYAMGGSARAIMVVYMVAILISSATLFGLSAWVLHRSVQAHVNAACVAESGIEIGSAAESIKR